MMETTAKIVCNNSGKGMHTTTRKEKDMGYSSVVFEKFKVNSTTNAIAKIVFTRACSKEGVEAIKWQTPVIWEELYSKMTDFCFDIMEGKFKPMETRTVRTESLAISYKFLPIAEYHKTLFMLEDSADIKENVHSKLLDYILCASATLKREHKNSCCTSRVNSPLKQEHQSGKSDGTPIKNVLAPRNTVKWNEQVDLIGSFKSPVNTVTGAHARKPNATSTVTSRPKLNKTKKSALSLKHKDTSSKTQSNITKYFVKTPPPKSLKSQTSDAHTLKELSPQNVTLKRKAGKEISYEEHKANKILKNLNSKENIGKKVTREEPAAIRLSRSKIKEIKQNQTVQMISIQEEEIETGVIKREKEDIADIVIKAGKCDDSPKRESYARKSKIKKIKKEKEEYGDENVAGCSHTKDEVKCEDTVTGDVIAKQMEEIIPQIRSPIKNSTPRRSMGFADNVDLTAYDLPADDPKYPQYLLDCEELKQVFITGEVDLVSKQLAQRMYEVHLPYVEAVDNRKVFSLIYDTFSKDEDEGHKMNYTEGCIIFSTDNLTLFAQNIGAHFSKNGDENMKKLNYFLKVLVPELVIKIVMGVYKINKSQALDKMLQVGFLVSERYGHVFF